ncbi:MAG: hypothetical protein HYU69_13695 [Bacteroidetes bacterium]|nr:hypothetical protein [Bacteroidota bacterium]
MNSPDIRSKLSYSNSGFYLSVIAVFVLLFWSYSNHFHNPFHFDDDHTIVSNTYIRDIKNIPLFFKDASTTSSLPANQVYRPGVTTLNAIDHWIGGKSDPDPFYYHVSIFVSFVVLGILLFFFFLKIVGSSVSGKWNRYLALFASAFFCLHTANAETINYIISRSDSFSTLMVVLAFVVYIYLPQWRSKFIYLIPALVGLFVKEPAMMFGPLLLLYVIFFEQELSLYDILKAKHRKQLLKGILTAVPAILLSALYFYFSRVMTPPDWAPGGGKWYYYLMTQPFVIVHYINNFLLPFNLSADTDWELVRSIFDDRVITGSLIILGLIACAVLLSGNRSTRSVTFGLLWFFIALLPTSSIFPLAEVLNDHRPFFPYIGLVIAFVGGVSLLVDRYVSDIDKQAKRIVLSIAILFLLSHAYGVHQRNKVWSTGESLWYDVTVKSPKNARGLMNYGNSQMAKGNYTVAQDYFERAIKLWPDYSYLYLNMGILKAAMGSQQEAGQNFSKAYSLNSSNPGYYYYYGNWLKEQGKLTEAKETVRRGLAISPGHGSIQRLYEELITLESLRAETNATAEQKVKTDPTPENYLELSLIYYKEKKYKKCIEASRQALKLKPIFAEAYNNICSAFNLIGEYDSAIVSGKEALRIKPDFELAKNNLNDAIQRKSKEDEVLLQVKQHPTAENYINLSLVYYNNGNFLKCIEAANESNRKKPNAIAYNNICAAYNVLKEWDKAIEAGEKGLAIEPGNQLLKNNLAMSKQNR